jgi:hypothetical protein
MKMHNSKASKDGAPAANCSKTLKRARRAKQDTKSSCGATPFSVSSTPAKYAVCEDVPVGELQHLLPTKLNLEHVRFSPGKSGLDQVRLE